jgi:hypothetical protein
MTFVAHGYANRRLSLNARLASIGDGDGMIEHRSQRPDPIGMKHLTLFRDLSVDVTLFDSIGCGPSPHAVDRANQVVFALLRLKLDAEPGAVGPLARELAIVWDDPVPAMQLSLARDFQGLEALQICGTPVRFDRFV